LKLAALNAKASRSPISIQTYTDRLFDEQMHHASGMEQGATVAQKQKTTKKIHTLTLVHVVLGAL